MLSIYFTRPLLPSLSLEMDSGFEFHNDYIKVTISRVNLTLGDIYLFIKLASMKISVYFPIKSLCLQLPFSSKSLTISQYKQILAFFLLLKSFILLTDTNPIHSKFHFIVFLTASILSHHTNFSKFTSKM